jgi:hypothetical protein
MDAHSDLPPFHSIAEHPVGDIICFPGPKKSCWYEFAPVVPHCPPYLKH